jgi:hypothetical protein
MTSVLLLALVFLALGWLIERSGRVSAAEAWILFLAGVFFWASGLGVILWVLVNGVFHAAGGK